MKGYILLKHGLKRLTGGVAAVSSRLMRHPSVPRIAVLMYHRVAYTGCFDSSVDDWNVTPHRFERQIAWLSRNAECLPITRIPTRGPAGEKPLVAVTFDDGFANFATQALPILERYRVPAAVFLVTGHVGTEGPYPFDRWAHRNRHRAERESWAPIDWDQVERCVESGLVTVGSHSHTHPEPRLVSPGQLVQEAVHSRDVLKSRLGEAHAFAYAYPYGSTRVGQVTQAYIDAVRQAGFTLGFATDLGVIRPGADPFALPRIEAHARDGPGVIAAKARGVLWPFRFTDAFRRAKRSTASWRL